MGSACPFHILASVYLPDVVLSALRRQPGSKRFDSYLRDGIDGWKTHKSLPKTLVDALGPNGWKPRTDDEPQVAISDGAFSTYQGATHYMIHEEMSVRSVLALPAVDVSHSPHMPPSPRQGDVATAGRGGPPAQLAHAQRQMILLKPKTLRLQHQASCSHIMHTLLPLASPVRRHPAAHIGALKFLPRMPPTALDRVILPSSIPTRCFYPHLVGSECFHEYVLRGDVPHPPDCAAASNWASLRWPGHSSRHGRQFQPGAATSE
eukprot:scaffold18456_cov124-Isochrysis_galbana.AAC.7